MASHEAQGSPSLHERIGGHLSDWQSYVSTVPSPVIVFEDSGELASDGPGGGVVERVSDPVEEAVWSEAAELDSSEQNDGEAQLIFDLLHLYRVTNTLLLQQKQIDAQVLDDAQRDEIARSRGAAAEARWQSLNALRRALCPSLRRGTNDVFEISKVATPVLLGLSLAGTLPFPQLPALVALVVLVIARVGVSAFCPESSGRSDHA